MQPQPQPQPITFKLPDLGEGVVEAEIVAWHVQTGEHVCEDQPLLDVMTDKATVTIPSSVGGWVLHTHGIIGETICVGAELVRFDTTERPPAPAHQGQPAEEPPVIVPLTPRFEQARETGTLPPLASPAVRRRARELDVDLSPIRGSGPNSRITHADIDSYLQGKTAPAAAPPRPRQSDTTEIHLEGLRRRIAEKVVVSSSEIPHFCYIDEVDITELDALRVHLNDNRTDGQPKLTYLPFVMLSVSRALGRFPEINACYNDKREVITRHEAVHLGIATQTDHGLCVPVVRHAEAMDLWGTAREMRRITEAARNHSITRDELTGSTFTISSLGAMGGIAATPIINHPEVAILGVNKAIERPVVRHGQIAIRRMVNLSASFDHRVVDGADGAAFVQCIKQYLEHPATIFLQS